MLRSHVLVMKYIGKSGYPAPRLKDAQLKLEQYEESYLELVKIMRRMFQVPPSHGLNIHTVPEG